MSYSVDEGVEDAEKHLAFLKALKEAYPDAIQQNQRWYSRSLTIADCTGFVLEASEDNLTYAVLFRTVGTGRVFRPYGRTLLNTFFGEMPAKNPEFFELLLHKIKDEG